MLTRLFAAAALSFAFALPLASTTSAAQEIITEETDGRLPDVVLGDPDAPITIIEYASMTCPHCATFHNGTFVELKRDYIDTGKVKFVLREYPFDNAAAAVSMLARCSGDKYYDVVDLFFETQRQWADPSKNVLAQINRLAKQAGFTQARFEECLTDQQLLDGINAVKDHGFSAHNVTATPTIFVDGERVEGARNMRTFRDIIEPKLDS